jgi:hypothetical protein
MNTRFAWGLAVTFCVGLTGCQSMDTSVRAQSPERGAGGPPAVQPAGAWYHGGASHHGGCGPECGACAPGAGGGTQMHYYLHQGCPHGHLCNALNPCHWCRMKHHGGMAGPGYIGSGYQAGPADPGPGWYPSHHHTYFYDVPDDGEFVYPPSGQPPAVVQYPYYTVRGPTDFFMQ